MRLSRLAFTLALSLSLSSSWAQTQDDIDTPREPSGVVTDRLVLERAVRDLILGQSSRAIASLSLAMSQQGVAADGEEPIAVLLRLASAMSLPDGASRLPERCGAEVTAPLRCALDRAARAIATQRYRDALGELDNADTGATLPPTHPILLLRRVARGREARELQPSLSRPISLAGAPPPSPFGVYQPALGAPRIEYSQGMSGVETVALYSTAVLWASGLGLWLATSAVREDAGGHTLLFPLIGAGAGVAAAYFIDRNAEVRRGRALAVQAGMWLGLTAGIGIAGATGASFDRDEQNLGSHALFLSSTAGMILGAGISAATDARPGSISFTFSTGFWGAYAGAMVESVVRASRSRSARFPAAGILVGEGVGIATGMILSRIIEPTAAQARWMDLGSLTGASVGLALGALAAGNRDTAMMPYVGSLVGMGAGMALGYVLGRPSHEDRLMNRERDGETGIRPSAFVMPVEGGAVAGVSL